MNDNSSVELSGLGQVMLKHEDAIEMIMTYRFMAIRSRADAAVLDRLLQSAVDGGRDLNNLREATRAALWALRGAGDYDNAGRMLHILDLLEQLSSVKRLLGTVCEDYKP